MDALYHPQQLPLILLTRVCLTCGIEKSLEERFNKQKGGTLGYRGYCKDCRAKERQEAKNKRPPFVCIVCQQEKLMTERYRAYRDERASIILCKDCASKGKHCSYCSVYKPFTDFAPGGTHERGGVVSYCKGCKPAVQRRTYSPIKARIRNLKRYYDLTPEEYDEMLQSQGGVCAICKQAKTRTLVVDHNHETGTVRGLLCSPCNTKLGILEEQPFVKAAHAYLDTYRV